VKNLYFLSIPEREKDSEQALVFRSKALKQWIAALPTGNYGMTTRLFHDHVQLMNKTEMEAAAVMEALELLYPTFQNIHEFLLTKIVGKGFPLSSDEQKIGQLTEAVAKDFFTAHWIVLQCILNTKSPGWRQGKAIPVYIERLIRGLSQILIIRFILHIPAPDWIWLDLHSLYRLAEKKGKENVKIKENSKIYGRVTTIKTAYKQILLIFLADPFGMTQHEILEIYGATLEWEALTEFNVTNITERTRCCVINLDEDSPPTWENGLIAAEQSESRFYVFGLDALIQKLSDLKQRVELKPGRFDLARVAVEKPLISNSLLQYLSDQWSGVEQEKRNLYEDKKPRLLSIGLKATHQQLNPPTNPEEKIFADWLVTINEDQSMRCEFDQPGQLFIGSLISSKRVDIENAKRLLGVVRRIWMGRMDGAVHFEIDVLTTQVIAAGIQPLKAKADLQVYQRALLFFTASETQQKGNVVLESQKLTNGSKVQLLMQSDSAAVVLDNRRSVGLGYTQFECIPIALEKQEILPPQGYDFL